MSEKGPDAAMHQLMHQMENLGKIAKNAQQERSSLIELTLSLTYDESIAVITYLANLRGAKTEAVREREEKPEEKPEEKS